MTDEETLEPIVDAVEAYVQLPGFEEAFVAALQAPPAIAPRQVPAVQPPVALSGLHPRVVWFAAASVGLAVVGAACGFYLWLASWPTSLELPIDTESTEVVDLEPTPDPFGSLAPRVPADLDLETRAILGALTAAEEALLEERTGADRPMSERDWASRLLLVNAFSAGRRAEWARRMEWHLTELDSSDPDLCYTYALHLSRTGRHTDTLHWADRALANRTVWTGSTYSARVYSLYKLRAKATQGLWSQAPNDARARKRTGIAAREWYEFGHAANKDTSAAMALCVSAMGEGYCTVE